jgi:hypothetical protein
MEVSHACGSRKAGLFLKKRAVKCRFLGMLREKNAAF